MLQQQVITRPVAEATAERFGIVLSDRNGVIGAVSIAGLPNDVLPDPGKNES